VRERVRSPEDVALHVCEGCESELVQPVRWQQAAKDRWAATLRCPNCGHGREGVFSQEQVDALDEALDDGYAVLLESLRELTEANMVEEIERFSAALRADAILPIDF
jgi:hypothetical protein